MILATLIFASGSLTRADVGQAIQQAPRIEKCREALVSERLPGRACSSSAQIHGTPLANSSSSVRCPKCRELTDGNCGEFQCPFASNSLCAGLTPVRVVRSSEARAGFNFPTK